MKYAHLTFKLLPHYLGKCKRIIFQQHSITISIKQPIFQSFPSTQHFKSVNCGTLLAYITVSVQSDLILPELQQHLFLLRSSSTLWMR